MTEQTQCPKCESLQVTTKYVVERTYINPIVGLLMGLALAIIFAVDTADVISTVIVAIGIAVLPMQVPVSKRRIELSRQCNRCAHKWTSHLAAHNTA